MTLIGLTGGIAAGKTTIARRFAQLGAHVLDADAQARDVVAPGMPALEAIRARFGDGVVDAGGSLDRPALGAIVFADPQARANLEAITHPAIRQLTQDRIAAIRAADPDSVIVYDVPLLVEAGIDLGFDAVVVAHAPAAVRRQRLVELRGMDPAEADRRIASQADDEARLAVATHVVRTDLALDETLAAVDAVWADVAGTA